MAKKKDEEPTTSPVLSAKELAGGLAPKVYDPTKARYVAAEEKKGDN